ncbi:hypothetical protein [Chamaesiphon sp.]|uniref:hypothetical protein n=1 Tax=Chamaesiphon sp. TaxID=2814140 RepID=UPI003593692D
MYQSSTRNNFLDILLDPQAIAILGSIALHAIIGAGLPFLSQPEKAGKKVGPSTVKVVQLTPSELRRIPQAPPAPAPQVLPPVAQPTPAPQPAVAPPRSPQFSTAPQTIPFSPIRAPFDGVTIKPPQGNKQQKVTPQKQPFAPIFDPGEIFKPTPKPSKANIPKGSTPKPSTKPTPKPTTSPVTKKTTAVAPTPQPAIATDDDGSDPTTTTTPSPTSTPTPQAQQSGGTPTPTPTPTIAATTPPITVPTGGATGNPGVTGTGLYGKYTRDANAQLLAYLKKYPNIKPYPPKQLPLQQYKSALPCPKVKQPPFIVLMVTFDKVPGSLDGNILGTSTSPLLNDEKPYVAGDSATLKNDKLMEILATAGFAAATEADKTRPEADKGKPVIYQYRVQAVCIPPS